MILHCGTTVTVRFGQPTAAGDIEVFATEFTLGRLDDDAFTQLRALIEAKRAELVQSLSLPAPPPAGIEEGPA